MYTYDHVFVSRSIMTTYLCRNCARPYPSSGIPDLCPTCGGIFTLAELEYRQPIKEEGCSAGVWRFKNSFGLVDDAPVSYLGEGQTPLVNLLLDGLPVWCKMEGLNPSGSFKDRATAVLVSVLRQRGAQQVIEDSSGNAGGSLALYANAFGIGCKVFVPASTSGLKRRQIEACGAELVLVDGLRENAHLAAIEACRVDQIPYASHAALPFGMAGIATIAFEIFEALGEMPGSVYIPAGHGSLLAGMTMGFDALVKAGFAERRPRIVGVQPDVCAPIAAAWHNEPFSATGSKSLAEGTMVERPARMAEILKMLDMERDQIVTVAEPEIAEAHRKMIKVGLFVEPTSAMVLGAMKKVGLSQGKTVFILSGTELKSLK